MIVNAERRYANTATRTHLESGPVESSTTEVEAPPAPDVRRAPAPRAGGPLALLRFMRRNRMLDLEYARLIAGLFRRRFLTRYGRRLRSDGLAFVAPDVVMQLSLIHI